MKHQRLLPQIVSLTTVLLLIVACSFSQPAPTPTWVTPASTLSPTSTLAIAPTDESPTDDPSSEPALSEAEREAATLGSLERVDEYPLYTMRSYGDYSERGAAIESVDGGWARAPRPSPVPLRPEPFGEQGPLWACSLFAALDDADHMLYGRNFDWEYSPALLLFTDPPDGYASVSMVDIDYLGFGEATAGTLLDLSLAERRSLLEAPFWPFDGMNERGLVVGMAAVPESETPYDQDKESIGSLAAIREMLDHAGNVSEAVAILESHNVEWRGGPHLHYLIADSSGRSVLVEFYEGEMAFVPNEEPWHLATNHLRAIADETGPSGCRRYDRMRQRLADAEGRLTLRMAMELLEAVAQGDTQWSIVYGMSTGRVEVSMGREYDNVHAFDLSVAGK